MEENQQETRDEVSKEKDSPEELEIAREKRRRRKLGSSDVQVTKIIHGTWQAGKSMWTGIDDSEVKNAMEVAFDQGITTFDTAEAYGDGYSERLLGEVFRDNRDEIEILTKVFPNHLSFEDCIEACNRSLRNLDTDYIDLYQIHWPSGSFDTEEVPIEETMRAMKFLKNEGKIKAIGVSNFSKEQIEEARQYGEIASVQPPYSLFWRYPEKSSLQKYCTEHNIAILAYSSLAQGLLTGKFGPEDNLDKKDNRSYNILFQDEHYQRCLDAVKKLKPLAERHETTVGNIALAWLIKRPQTCAIVGARNSEQARQNSQALNVKLSPEEREKIEIIGREVTKHLNEGENPVMWDVEQIMSTFM